MFNQPMSVFIENCHKISNWIIEKSVYKHSLPFVKIRIHVKLHVKIHVKILVFIIQYLMFIKGYHITIRQFISFVTLKIKSISRKKILNKTCPSFVFYCHETQFINVTYVFLCLIFVKDKFWDQKWLLMLPNLCSNFHDWGLI